MPLNVTNIVFSDEFNSGTTTDLNVNIGDEITATIDLTYSNIIDASLDGTYTIKAISSDDIVSSFPSGKQCFQISSNLEANNQENILEYYSGNMQGAEITLYNNGGGVVGTFTFLDIDDVFNVGQVICCNEADSLSATYGNHRLVITEDITNISVFTGINSSLNDYTPILKINNDDVVEFKYLSNDLDCTDTITIVDIPFSQNADANTGSLSFRGLGVSNDVQSFELTHSFIVTPITYYRLNGVTQPTDANIPTNEIQNAFIDAVTSRIYYHLGGALKNQVNGGVEIPFDFQNLKEGDISLFNRRNGTNTATNYSITNFAMERTSDSESTQQPLITEKFTVSFDVENSTDTPFSDGNTLIKVGIENAPESILNQKTDYIQSFLYDRKVTTLGSATTTGDSTGDAASITNYTTTFNSSSSISVSFDVDFTSNAETQIQVNSKRWIRINCEVQDHTLNYTNNDRTVLTVYNGEAIDKILANPIVETETKFIPFYNNTTVDSLLNTELDNYPVQLIVGYTKFYADWTDRDDLRIDSINQQLVFINSSTNEEIVIDSNTVNASGLPLIDNKYPQANVSISKGYQIPSDEIRNKIQFVNDFPSDSGDEHHFICYFPFFIRWEYYTKLLLTSVPNSIIDTNEDFDGVNYDNYRIDQLANWDLYYRTTFNCSENSATFSQSFDYELDCSDYEADGDVVTREIRTYTDDEATELEFDSIKYVQKAANSLILSEWDTGGTINSIDDFDIEIWAEPFEGGSPNKIQRISSINGLLSSSWFSDLSFVNGLVEKSISTNKAIGKAIFDVSKAVFYDKYTFYSNIIYNEGVIQWIFKTENDISIETFDPLVTTSGGEVVTWTLKNGSAYNINSLNIPAGTVLIGDELDGTCQDVAVTFSTNDPLNILTMEMEVDIICEDLDLSLFQSCTEFMFNTNSITSVIFPSSSVITSIIRFENNSLAGNVDLSVFTNLGGIIRFNNNSITSLTTGSSTRLITEFLIQNNDLTTLDLSGYSRLSNNIRFAGNPSLSDVSLPNSAEGITNLIGDNCALTVLDLSTLTDLGGNIRFQNNSLTSITFPSSSRVVTFLLLQSNNLTTLDLSPMTGLGGDIQLQNNSLTSITMPTSTATLTDWQSQNNSHGYIDFTNFGGYATDITLNINNNGISEANINQILIDLDSVLTATGTAGNVINMTSNTAPTGAGLTAKNNLIAKSYNVNTD